MSGDSGNIYGSSGKRTSQTKAMGGQTNQFLKAKREARVKAKHDTESGMTSAQRNTINQLEAKHADRRQETGYVVDSNGNIITQTFKAGNHGSGKSASFRSSDLAGKDLSNAFVTHNHPYASYGDYKMQRAARMDGVDSKTQFSKGIGSRIGTSFSDADLRLATKYNLKGIRARTANYVFNIERTGKSWNVSADQIQREWRKAYNKYSSQVQRVANRSRDWNMSRVYQGRAEALISHQATKEVAKMFGLKYTRRKIR